MRFNSENVDDVLVVKVPNTDVDASNAEEFKRDVALAVEGHPKIAMDLGAVSFMDSAGLGAMLSVYKKVRSEGGRFAVFAPSAEVKDLFELVRMHRLFEIYPDRKTAVEALRA